MDNKFKIVVTSYNNEQWTETCLKSLLDQTYKNYEVIFFNDGSTDKTIEIVHNTVNTEKFKIIDLHTNNTKSWIFANLLSKYIDDNDIVLFLDGDDWLSSTEALNTINQFYQIHDPWVAYGGMIVWNGGEDITEPYPQNSEFPIHILNNKSFRQDTWRSSHTKTMRGFIWKSLNKNNLISKQDNRYILGPDDLVIMFDALERCQKNKIGRFNFPTYVYNHSQENVGRIQEHQKKRNINYEAEIRTRLKNDTLPILTSELSGGVGNQLFQIAATISIAKKFGYVPMFDSNTHFLPLQGRKIETYKNNLFRNIIFSKDLIINRDYIQSGFHFEEPTGILPFTKLKGGFQSEKYFDIDLVGKTFCCPENIELYLTKKYGSVSNKTSLHVRRGDYLKLYPHHIFVGEKYYTEAINKIENGEFLVFSDDLEWCKSFFKGKQFDFIVDEDYNELYLMSLCKNNIIGNSTFSWWGAWLNSNENKVVIAPKNWFGPGYSNFNMSDLIPKKWMKI